MKKSITGFCLGVVMAMSGSVFAVGLVGTSPVKLTPQEQISKGNVFNIYTGQKLVPVEVVPASEARLRSIESRLSALEAKVK